MTPFTKLDAKLFAFVLLACTISPIYAFISEQELTEQNIISILAVATAANFSLYSRGRGAACFFMNLIAIVSAIAGDFIGHVVVSIFIVSDITWLSGWFLELLAILIFVSFFTEILKAKEIYIQSDKDNEVRFREKTTS